MPLPYSIDTKSQTDINISNQYYFVNLFIREWQQNITSQRIEDQDWLTKKKRLIKDVKLPSLCPHMKTPKVVPKSEPTSPSEVQRLRKKFEVLLSQTHRKAQEEEFEKLRSRSTSVAFGYRSEYSKRDSTHKGSLRLPEAISRNALIEAVRERINAGSSESPSKTRTPKRNKSKQPLIPMTLPRPVYGVLQDLNVKPPEPKVKFFQLIESSPFNRAQKEELVAHFLKDYKFLGLHSEDILKEVSGRVTLEKATPFPTRALWIVEHGSIVTGGVRYGVGQLANEQILQPQVFEFSEEYQASENCRVLAIPKYDYLSALSLYISKNCEHFIDFMKQSPTLKMVPADSVGRLGINISCRFLLPGSKVYRVGDKVSGVYFVYSGRVFRKVIVSLEEQNRIPVSHSEHLVKSWSKSYEFKINFERGEMFGYGEIINGESLRNEQIEVEVEGLFLHVGVVAFNDILDQHTTKTLRDQKSKKYPDNYDGLCERFASHKHAFNSTEKIKIAALTQCYRYEPKDDVERKSRRVSKFISKSLQKISDYERLALVKIKKIEKVQRKFIG